MSIVSATRNNGLRIPPRTIRLLGPLLAAAVLTLAPAVSAARPAFLVPTSPAHTGFGPFTEFGGNSVDALVAAFGTAASTRHDGSTSCRMAWPELGVSVKLTTYGQEIDPCTSGYFLAAVLRDARWHTRSGIHPGSRSRRARRASLRTCDQRSCPGVASGYALGLHTSDCAAGRFPGVVAHIVRRRVAYLQVLTHGCE